MACNCPKTLAFLRSLGATHSAAMHDARNVGKVWTVGDWLLHFAEEERLIFPLLPVEEARAFAEQHEMFRRAWHSGYPVVTQALLDKHATGEDAAVSRLMTRGARR